MGMTLIEYAKMNLNDVRSPFIEMYAQNSEILRVLPFDDIKGGAMKYNREGTLPGVGFRGINESYTPSTGVINPETESLSICGGEIDVDKFNVRTMGDGRKVTDVKMKIKALALSWTRAFIKGDQTADPRSIQGVQGRLVGQQLIPAGATPGGDALSLYMLGKGIDAVDDPTHLIMSKDMRQRITQASRNMAISGIISNTKDEFGRLVTMYNDLPILVMGKDNINNEILPFNEVNPGGGVPASTSIYCVSFSDGMFTGIQNGAMEVTELGELEIKPAFRTRIEWYAGMAIFHGRAAARLYGIKDAPCVL